MTTQKTRESNLPAFKDLKVLFQKRTFTMTLIAFSK